MNYEKIFKNKVVLITGGTGFLGKALIKRILKYDPQSIRIFSRDEVKHHKIQELFKNNNKLRNLIGDVRDYKRIKKACEGVDIVIHAAALKRLDILEYNVSESINTNIIGTLNVVDACLDNNVEKAIFISTDKACDPVNTYGACKFVGERTFIESNYSKGNKKTIFSCVRYGNVLESTGSVIPLFESKIKNNEKIPLTDKKMTRFIISHDQAVTLVFNALKYSLGGEIFIPKLPSFKIIDLIDILKDKNNVPNHPVEIIGIRPGEKIHELMINLSEIPRTYKFKDMFIILSFIEKYGSIKNIEYLNENNKLDEKNILNYSSQNEILKKNEICSLFKEFNLL
jgi:UDP-N-acetylglucosamine 4,6-dehydratase/5-epimerase